MNQPDPVPLVDKHGRTPDNPDWRVIDDTWCFCGLVNGLYFYQKIHDGHPVDIQARSVYAIAVDYKELMVREKRGQT